EAARDGQDLPEKRGRVGVAQLGRIRDVRSAPNHDGVSGLADAPADEIRGRDATGEEPGIPMRVVGAALGAHRRRLTRTSCLPVGVPRPRHRLNASVPSSYTRSPSSILAASHSVWGTLSFDSSSSVSSQQYTLSRAA